MGSRIRLVCSRLTAHTPGDNYATVTRHRESCGKWDSANNTGETDQDRHMGLEPLRLEW